MLTAVDVHLVDPRDTKSEVRTPAYRVYFWEQQPAVDAVVAVPAWSSEEFRLIDAMNVHEVLSWATGAVGRGRQFELFVETTDAAGTGLLRLAGSEPTAGA